MFHILGFLFFFVLVILIIGLVLLSKIVRTIFGFGRKMTRSGTAEDTYRQRTTYAEDTRRDDESQYSDKDSRRRNKVFDSDEGEYIDFEEIKDK